jgi:addiction module HigA family antidote
MNTLPNVHPGEVLRHEFLEPMGITPYRLARDIGVQQTRIAQLLKGTRSVTVDTAIRLSRYFGTTPDLWLNMQARHDLEDARLRNGPAYDAIRPYADSHSTGDASGSKIPSPGAIT